MTGVIGDGLREQEDDVVRVGPFGVACVGGELIADLAMALETAVQGNVQLAARASPASFWYVDIARSVHAPGAVASRLRIRSHLATRGTRVACLESAVDPL